MHIFPSEEGAAGSPTPPQPPQNLTVIPGNLNVYTVIKQADKFLLLVVGTVPEGTPCDTTQAVNGHNVIPTLYVEWSGTVEPIVVVGKCAGNM